MRTLIGFVIVFLQCNLTLLAQVQKEIPPPENIRSIVFTGNNNAAQFPVIQPGQTMVLTFDDLYADEADYYYRIEHCNYDWTPSNLVKNQYLDGLDNQRILQYDNSLASIQPYTAYRLELPNRFTRMRISGNYILKIFDNTDQIVFSRRFILFNNAVNVGGIVKRPRDPKFLNTGQRIEFTVSAGDFELVNPLQEVKVSILQNSNFNTAVHNIKPQFVSGSQLIYKYEKETSFEGGNEYLNLDTKDIRTATNTVARVDLKNRYNHYLYTNPVRRDMIYTYFPDINGDFRVRLGEGVQNDDNSEADYSFVHFSLEYQPWLGLKDVYVYGKFNNYELTKENKLTFNADNNTLETTLFLKQGFYNFKYVIKNSDGSIDLNAIGGNHWETENEYLVLVYYRNFGALYDSVIGVANISSVDISN
ncbi:DUF5103 domain-containing protein [Robertkochia marina]|uniref:DUF5103 domain-containing protein n=1 Tax=Robertkochia marina TaxID=1227945 RepID=A0A4S3LXM1_9FLAO|nr:DUF5103 domain-containing protein [Robertkochia marina]THD66308.1 DUF5103 domain-containing protein [Robertkochia marina]TRZ41228.1 DUF5103 domain-containing protein [Robertkochia marina]